MKCKKCGFDNDPKNFYCFKCGAKLTFTKKEIKRDYEKRIAEEEEQKTIKETRDLLMISLFIFTILLIIKIIFSGFPVIYVTPKISNFKLLQEKYLPQKGNIEAKRISLSNLKEPERDK